MDLMSTAYAKGLVAAAKETDETKKLRQVSDKVTEDYRVFQDAFVKATREVEDAERLYKRQSEDLLASISAKSTEIEAVNAGKFGVDFDYAVAVMQSVANEKKNLEAKLEPLAAKVGNAKFKLQFITEQGKKFGFIE
jgi:seryl-tRNA synthetase